MKMKKRRKHPFTLVEILVSMAVFSILLTLMVQFFSSARTLWVANEKRASVYADASAAIDLMEKLLQTTYFSENSTPFEISGAPASATAYQSQPAAGWTSTIMFVSDSPMRLSSGGSIRYLRLQRGPTAGTDDHVLQLRVYSDTDTNFNLCFQPFGTDDPTVGGARTEIKSKLNSYTDAAHVKTILHNVTGLKITPVNRDGTKNVSAANHFNPPVGIEIELSLMADEATAREWADMPKSTTEQKAASNNFRNKNEYTFRRTVWLGDRTFQ